MPTKKQKKKSKKPKEEESISVPKKEWEKACALFWKVADAEDALYDRTEPKYDKRLRQAAKRMGWTSGKRGKGRTYDPERILEYYKKLISPPNEDEATEIFKVQGEIHQIPVSKEVAIDRLADLFGFSSKAACYTYLKKHKAKGLPSKKDYPRF